MWYHVTNEYFGKEKVFKPRLPRNANKSIISIEGNIPRICVSNSIFKCLLAIHGINYLTSNNLYFEENPCVYFTEEEPYLPPDCTDFRENDERWFIKKTKFYYLAMVDMYKLFVYNKIIPTNEKELKLPKKAKQIFKAKEIFIQSLILKG